MSSLEQIIQRTRQWIERLVIGHELCPFARFPYEKDLIAYEVVEGDPIAACEQMISQMDEQGAMVLETALLILPDGYGDFLGYLDLVADAEQWIADHDYEGVYQIASFHPQYQFADLSADDVRNYTNRSPYPMLHILREDSISRAVDSHPDVDSIPVRNQEKMLELGLDGVKEL